MAFLHLFFNNTITAVQLLIIRSPHMAGIFFLKLWPLVRSAGAATKCGPCNFVLKQIASHHCESWMAEQYYFLYLAAVFTWFCSYNFSLIKKPKLFSLSPKTKQGFLNFNILTWSSSQDHYMTHLLSDALTSPSTVLWCNCCRIQHYVAASITPIQWELFYSICQKLNLKFAGVYNFYCTTLCRIVHQIKSHLPISWKNQYKPSSNESVV